MPAPADRCQLRQTDAIRRPSGATSGTVVTAFPRVFAYVSESYHSVGFGGATASSTKAGTSSLSESSSTFRGSMMSMPQPNHQSGTISMEESPFRRFHGYVTLCTLGGPIADGYILGIIAIALPQMSADLQLSALWNGLLGASALIGMFIGGVAFGWVTDRVGRRVLYTIDLAVFAAASIPHLWVEEPWLIFVLRLIVGIAIGADFPIATSLLAEWIPRRQRGSFLASLVGGYWVGYTLAFVVGYFITAAGGGSWKWALASPVIPALFFLIVRAKMPESPVWLASKGRRDQAQEVIRRHIGTEYTLPTLTADRPRSEYKRVFSKPYGKRLFFVSSFWFVQVLAQYSILTFQPELLSSFGVENSTLGTMIVSLFFMVGVIPGVWLVHSWGRRPVLLVGFVAMAAALGILGAVSILPTRIVIVLFIMFAIFNAGSSVVQWVYPNELFPTDVRATGVGFSTAMSRIGASVGTFLLPLGLANIGTGPSMLVVAGLCVVALAISIPLAPEPGKTALGQTSAADET